MKIKNYVKLTKQELGVPAVGMGMIVGDQAPLISVSGLRKQGNDTKVTISDKWHIGSCAKSMTATLTAILINSGKYEQLNWDTPLSNIFEYQVHETLKDVTLKELLSHRSGIQDPEQWDDVVEKLKPLEGDVFKERAVIAETFLQKEANYDRINASEAHYSNIGYVIVGAVLEKITGKSWEQLMVQHIFNPLSMSSAGFGMPQNEKLIDPDQPWGHSENLEPTVDPNPSWLNPAGGVHSSLEDLLKFLKIHMQKQYGFDILYDPIENNSDMNIGGWVTGELENLKILQAFGSDGTYLASFRIIPKLKSIIVCVTNSSDSKKSMEKFGQILNWGMNIAREEVTLLNMHQEKLTWSWTKKLIEENESLKFAASYKEAHPEAEASGYGPFALVPYNDEVVSLGYQNNIMDF